MSKLKLFTGNANPQLSQRIADRLGYSLGRVWIEGLRIDPLCVGALPPACEGGLRIAQLMSAMLMVLGALGLWWLKRRQRELPTPTNS